MGAVYSRSSYFSSPAKDYSIDNYKRMSADEDIISNLPEDLINPILERLPVKDAVRTSVLSKNWRHRWTTMSTLNFSPQFSEKFANIGAYQHNGFIRIINHIMIHHQGPILEFYLCIPKEIVIDSFQEVDHWMLILSRNHVRLLNVWNSNRIYQLPSSVFSCLELRVLALRKCIFNPPLEFQGFPTLKHIVLNRVNFGGNLGGIVISLPCLKTLNLDTCVHVNHFNIKAVNLRTLKVVSCPDAILLRFIHSERINEVFIRLFKSMQDFLQVERFNMVTMLSKLPQLVTFTIDGYFLKFFAAENFPKSLPHAIKCLQQLNLQSFSFGDLEQLQGALCMLRTSTNLKALHVTHMQMGPDADLDLTSNYLESLKCLDQTLFTLKTIEITSLEGTRPELLFIKLLLDCSPYLDYMIIRPRATTDDQNMRNIARNVMMFPRASRRAKMFYVDPKP